MDNNIAYHRKYRPLSISQYMGDGIKTKLGNRFGQSSMLPQTILLHGSRGCGKTSAARLIAKEYHCTDKVDGHACGECYMCKEIEDSLIVQGVAPTGVSEVDIASESGKKDMDEMLEDAMIPPMYPIKYKVIIMDECHMATNQAQNRLLKIVEEPPQHLVFIFCTTDPDKILPTLKSRCQLVLEVKRPNIDELANKLLEVCESEGITTSMEALKIIAKKSGRIPREALNLLEDIATDNGKKVTIDSVRAKLGEIAVEIYMEFYKAACDQKNPVERLLMFSSKLKEQEIPIDTFISGLIRFTLDCMKLKYAIEMDDFPVEFVKATKDFFNIYNPEELDFLLQILEYAIKLTNKDEDKSELVLLTTGLRIGKTKLLGLGLNDSDRQAAKENKGSVKSYTEAVKEADRQTVQNLKTSGNVLNDALVASVFGTQITEVNKYIVPEVADGPTVDEDGAVKNSSAFNEIVDFFTDSKEKDE